jgi:hypothetical protein
VAGSYGHITDDQGHLDLRAGLIENLGDAGEALTECHGMIQWLAGGDRALIAQAEDQWRDGPRSAVVEDLDLTPEEAAEMWRQHKKRACSHCGGSHVRACPRVRRLEFHENGRLRSVSFWPRGEWSDEGILWPEDIPGDPPEA